MENFTHRKKTTLAGSRSADGPPTDIPQQALYWDVPGFKRRPGRPRAKLSGKGQSRNKICESER